MKPRLIPSILLKHRLAFVSRLFDEYNYVGDPLNILNILSSCCADEVHVVDKSASVSGQIDRSLLEKLRSVSDFPLAYAGGIRAAPQIDIVFGAGFDKILLSACNTNLIQLAQYTHDKYGSQALGLSLDYSFVSHKRHIYNPYSRTYTQDLAVAYLLSLPVQLFSDILLTSVSFNGLSSGVDGDILESIASSRLRNPILLAGGLHHYNSTLVDSLTEKNPHFSGIAASTSVFLQNYSFGSALVSLTRHAF